MLNSDFTFKIRIKYIIIELISKNTDFTNYLRIFLSYDLEKEVSFIVNNTENLLKYISIINKNMDNYDFIYDNISFPLYHKILDSYHPIYYNVI